MSPCSDLLIEESPAEECLAAENTSEGSSVAGSSAAALTRSDAVEGEASRELTRRAFLAASGLVSAGVAAGLPAAASAQKAAAGAPSVMPLSLSINKQQQQLTVDTRTTLLDLLRENLDLTGTKKGCDHGQCGSCTVLLNGRRVNACLTLAFVAQGAEITTIEGLGDEASLSPAQKSFLEHDGYQCGYCTPGQICSATALVGEAGRGELSLVSFETGKLSQPAMSDDEIRERMSGNICRCGAYPNIVAAVRALTSAASGSNANSGGAA